MHLARDDHKVVCTLQKLIQGFHKLAATLQGCNNLVVRLPQPRNFHMGLLYKKSGAIATPSASGSYGRQGGNLAGS